jgi:type VI secretion system protein ImpB
VAPKERVYIIYETAEGEFPSSQEVELPLKILMMGDYTTREDWTPLDERRPINVRDDNFNEVLREHELKLDLNVPDKLSQEQGAEILVKLRFEKMKDFSPEGVACQVPELRKLIELRSALDALRGPLGGVTAFRSKLQAILDDEALKAQLLRELAAPAPPLRPPPRRVALRIFVCELARGARSSPWRLLGAPTRPTTRGSMTFLASSPREPWTNTSGRRRASTSLHSKRESCTPGAVSSTRCATRWRASWIRARPWSCSPRGS